MDDLKLYTVKDEYISFLRNHVSMHVFARVMRIRGGILNTGNT